MPLIHSLAVATFAATAPIGVPAATTHASNGAVTTTRITNVNRSRIDISGGVGDYPHVSAGTASAHGWWIRGNAQATRARVTIVLQMKVGQAWVTKGTKGSAVIRPGGGSSARVTAKAHCVTSGRHQWRSEIDVDLVGEIDSPNKAHSPTRTLNCGA
jgi:hypothetical protein